MCAERTALPLTVPRIGLVARFTRMIEVAWKFWNGRRTLRRLNELSDWELRDIGLTREDITNAYEVPIFSDPTRYLLRAREASTRRRA